MLPLIDYFLSKFSLDLAIDLGTANTLVHVGGRGIMVREPSVVTCHKKTRRVLAIGVEAKKMIGKTPASLEVVRPLKDGVISDFDITLAMISTFVKKIHARPGKRFSLIRPRVVIGIPSEITEVQRRAVLEIARASGARVAYLVFEPMAAAIGAGQDVLAPVGSMIVDIGGGTCEIAIISLGGIVVSRCLKTAGDAMDRDIVNYVRLRHGLILGEKTAEEIKILLSSALPMPVEKEMVARGRDLEKGIPKTVKLTSTQIREALSPSVSAIVQSIKDTIEDVPPELAADISERGIVICGGGALIYGLAKLISTETKMPVSLADEPLSCVVLGCAKVLGNRNLLERVKVTG